MAIQAWTDYPIFELGDRALELAPIRLCEVVAYDRDKYCYIKIQDICIHVKVGYLYKCRTRWRAGGKHLLSQRQLKKLHVIKYGNATPEAVYENALNRKDLTPVKVCDQI